MLEGLSQKPPRRETARSGRLFDPRGSPLVAGRVLAARSAQEIEHHSDIVVPDLGKTLPKEFRDKITETLFRKGSLYVPNVKDGENIVLDVDTAPADTRAEKKLEYLDFSEMEIEAVFEAHTRYKTNLSFGDTQQQGIYLTHLLAAAGFDSANTDDDNYSYVSAFMRGAAEAIAQERKHNHTKKPCLAREAFLAQFFATKKQIAHPLPEQDDASKKRGRKIYRKDAPYRQLSLLFMPKIWDDMNQEERLWLLDSVVTVYEYTANPAEIDSPELFLRLTQILVQEQDVGVRSLIYLLFDTVPYALVPQEAKNALARVIAERKEFQAPIAVALLTDLGDKTGIKSHDLVQLRQEYLVFRQNVLDRLAQPSEELAAMSFPDWMKLVQDVEHLSLLSITDDKEEADILAQEKFGIELELSPYQCLEQGGYSGTNALYILSEAAN